MLRTVEHMAQEYAGHRQSLYAAICEVVAALPHSALVSVGVTELAEAVILPQFDGVVATVTAALEGTRCAVATYHEADAQMAQHSLASVPRPGAGGAI